VGGVKCNLIGEDFITMYRCVWDHDESCLVIKGSRIPLEESDKGMGSRRVIALETILVPGGHAAVIKSGLSNRINITDTESFVGVLTPERSFLKKYGLAIAKALVDAANDVLLVRVFNPRHTDVRVYKHTHIALFTPVSRVGPTVILNNCEPDRAYHVDKISMKNEAVPEHLQSIFKTGYRHLDDDQKVKFKKFLLKNLGTHNITLKDETPVRETPRRIPMYKRHALEEEIKKLKERGLIEKSSSPWSSQVVMVEKKNGSWRMCVDYRKLNKKTIKDAYLLTRIDENLDTLDGADWYTSLDLDMAYHQVPMTDEDKEKTAFATPRGGLYQFTAMLFSLCNAACTFERIIEKALRGLQCCASSIFF